MNYDIIVAEEQTKTLYAKDTHKLIVNLDTTSAALIFRTAIDLGYQFSGVVVAHLTNKSVGPVLSEFLINAADLDEQGSITIVTSQKDNTIIGRIQYLLSKDVLTTIPNNQLPKHQQAHLEFKVKLLNTFRRIVTPLDTTIDHIIKNIELNQYFTIDSLGKIEKSPKPPSQKPKDDDTRSTRSECKLI